MTQFRIILIVFLLIITGYTIAVVAKDGANLVPVFVSNIVAVNWSGQFNLDFLLLLWLGAIWVAWRHGFSAGGIALAVVGHTFGMVFFTVYLLWAISRAGGDTKRLLLGVHADQ
ncbi:MAG: hypothetical protein AAF393_02740 [Pseudomonadota bacterium]